jgi:hypothetical protein
VATMEDDGTDEKVMRLCCLFCLRIRRGVRGGGDPRKVSFARGTSWCVQLPGSGGLEVQRPARVTGTNGGSLAMATWPVPRCAGPHGLGTVLCACVWTGCCDGVRTAARGPGAKARAGQPCDAERSLAFRCAKHFGEGIFDQLKQ